MKNPKTSHSIASATCFESCNKKQRARLEELSSVIEIRTGVTLARQGETGKEFGVIIEGSASVSIDGEQVASLGPGDLYGEMALFAQVGHTDNQRTATVTATSDMWVALMTRQEFSTFKSEFPQVATSIRAIATGRAAANDLFV